MSSSSESTRRLSLPRLLLALLIVAAVGAVFYLRTTQRAANSNVPVADAPWFASYVDVTATPFYSFQHMGDPSKPVNAVLSFVVALKDEPCTPSWGSVYSLEKANAVLSLDTRIARLKQRGGSIAVSFGGLLNDELSKSCQDPKALLAAYKAVIDRYQIDTIDMDLEVDELKDEAGSIRRAEVLSTLQRQYRESGKSLAVWLTLPATTSGLAEEGTTMVATFLKYKVDLAGINVMTMNFGETLAEGQSMSDGSRASLVNTHRQLGILYEQSGTYLSKETVWSKIGATPMIGQNDKRAEVFTLEDAKNLNAFAREQKIARLSMWSANRDLACGGNYANTKVVSDSCSGVAQESAQFFRTLADGFHGDISSNADQVTTSDEQVRLEDVVDDPARSPYQIWTKTGTYLQGTKVVWRKNVYQAKWWTQGDTPDNPVLQTWETPWELIGPVLPGDKPIAQPILPTGTYPEWRGTSTYNAGQRVLFGGVPYQAKWWTQGDSPAAAAANPNGSPWLALTQEQIEAILKQIDED